MTYAALDEALAVLRTTSPELANGAPNHGPMAAEALCALGRPEAVAPWVARYSGYTASDGSVPDTPEWPGNQWLEELGRSRDAVQWSRFFSSRLKAADWTSVVADYLPPLLPGAMATGTHGPIRCGHAVRALKEGVDDLRVEELAHALSYCAARYRPLRIIDVPRGHLELDDALRAIPRLGREVGRDGPPPRIIGQLRDREDFHRAVQQVSFRRPATEMLDALTEAGARLYLANARHHPLVLLHAVTGPAALRLLIDLLRPDDREVALAYSWQAVAAWTSGFTQEDAGPAPAACPLTWDDLISRAVDTNDEHAFKFTEACRRQEQRTRATAFKVAAADWISRLEKSREMSMVQKARSGITTRGLS